MTIFSRNKRKRNNNSGNQINDDLSQPEIPPPERVEGQTLPPIVPHIKTATTSIDIDTSSISSSSSNTTPPTTTLPPSDQTLTQNPTSSTLPPPLNLESSRLEIGLLALGILILVAQMGALIYLGVKRRQRSAQWHYHESTSSSSAAAAAPEYGPGNNSGEGVERSRFASTAGFLFRRPDFTTSRSTLGVGVPLGSVGSSWARLKAKLGGLKGKGGTAGGGGGTGSGNGNGNGSGSRCLFDEVFPPPNSNVHNTIHEGQEAAGLGHVDGTGVHHHGLVLGPPTVIPVINPAPVSAFPPASDTGGVGEFMEKIRRKSSAILAETIMPPVHAQMEVLTEIGRRVSGGLQAGAGLVLGRDGRKEKGGVSHEDGDGGYSSYKKDDGQYRVGYGDDSDLSDEYPHSLTPPEKRYEKDLEIGVLRSPSFGMASPSAASDINGSGDALATSSGTNRRVSIMDFVPSAGAGGGAGGGLVRRTMGHKRVSFVEGGRSDAGSPGKRRHSSFVFHKDNESAKRSPNDEEKQGEEPGLGV